MTRVSFYVLKDPAADRDHFVCRLLERIYSEGQHAYVHAPDAALQRHLDDLLWTWRQGSFVPHDLETSDTTSPVVIGDGSQLPAQRDVLLNLDTAGLQPPAFFSSFERALEIVGGDESQRRQARQRYSFYRDRGYELDTFNINA